jgi:hypothetical protein
LQIIKHRVVTKNLMVFLRECSTPINVMAWRSSVAAPFLLVLLFLTSCVVPIAAPVPAANNAKKARYVAELEPPSEYNHSYDGLVEERVLPVAEVRVVCDSLGASHSSADASTPGGTAACAWVNDDTCFIILPDDELAPVDTYRRHEIAHCNGWPADHPHDG